MRFIAELKRRNVIRVGVAYLVASWLLLQIVQPGDKMLNERADVNNKTIAETTIHLSNLKQ